jgi:hypothetical protein
MTPQDYVVELARAHNFQCELQTLRSRGPHVQIRIKGLREYLVHFNRPKVYLNDQSAAALRPTAAFYPVLDSGARKSLRTRLAGLWRSSCR